MYSFEHSLDINAKCVVYQQMLLGEAVILGSLAAMVTLFTVDIWRSQDHAFAVAYAVAFAGIILGLAFIG